MPRPSPLSFRRAKLPEWTIQGLADPLQPDFQPIDWTLRRLDPLAQSTVGHVANAFVADHAENGLPTVAEEVLTVTQEAAQEAAAVHAMQVRLRVSGEEQDLPLYSIEEVYAMMPTLPDAWQRVQIVALVLQKGELPPQAVPAVEAEGPEFVALAQRHGSLPRDEAREADSPNGVRGRTPAMALSP